MSSLGKKKGRRYSRIAPHDDESSSFFTPSPMVDSKDGKSVSELDLRSTVTGRNEPTYIPPWTEPYVIGIAGFSGSGKTSVSQRIIQELNQPWTVLLLFDNFYKPLTPEDYKLVAENNYDFDTPDSIDIDLAVETLRSLKEGKKTEIPVYSFAQHARTDKKITIYGATVIIIEGIYALYDKRLLDLMDIKVFVDTELDLCLARRLTRDILYRGRNVEGVIRQWERFVKPNSVASVAPTMQNADLVIPRGLDNSTAIDVMIKHIQNKLALKSAEHLERLKALGLSNKIELSSLDNLKLLPRNNHTAGIHSILFDVHTERTDFIFYFDRIANLLIEQALEQLTCFEETSVSCPSGYEYKGLKPTHDFVAVSIIRSGDCFMNSLRKTFPDIPVGKLLIQSDSLTGEPQLHMEALPQINEKSQYFLFDAQIISGAGAIMAIQVLLDHEVKERNIVLISYLLTEVGVRRIFNVFPNITLIVGRLSNMEEVNQEFNSEGFKDTDWMFRNRFIDSLYFGTD